MLCRLLAVFGIVCSRWTATAEAAEFDKTIQPLLKARCVKCHGPIGPKGGLDLSSAAGLVRGGESGAVVAARSLDKSALWKRIEADEMPPDEPLPAAEKEVIR